MKPFAFLVARPKDATAIRESEYATLLSATGLRPDQLHSFSLSDRPDIELQDYSGIFVSGSPYSFTTAYERKTPEQLATEEALFELNSRVLERDFPYFGLCFGYESIALSLGV